MKEEKFNFKFLNTIMYIGAIIGIYYILKNIGIMDKIVEAFFGLIPVYLGFLVCWLSMPFANKLRKLGLNKNVSAFVALILIFGILITLFALIIPMFVEQLTTLIKDLPNLYNIAVEKINWLLNDKLHLEQQLQLSPNIQGLSIIQDNLGNILNYSINTIQYLHLSLTTKPQHV